MSIYLLLLMILMAPACSSQETNFFGTVITYFPKRTSDGEVKVVLRYKLNFQTCSAVSTWTCFRGDCGTQTDLVLNTVHQESSGEWCQREGVMTRQVPGNGTFLLELDGGNWTDHIVNGIESQRAVTLVELRNRSDTGLANRSPQTTVLPLLRVPSNCKRDFQLLAFDPDGDEVKCRNGKTSLFECDPCTPPPVLNLSSSCSLSFKPNSSSDEGPYAVQLMMEDFPQETILLTDQTDGSPTVITTNEAISKLPVQFVLRVDPEVPSCTEGHFLPKFLAPTPENGAQLKVSVQQLLEIRIRAVANNSQISELLLSGPFGINQTNTGPGEFTVKWIPAKGLGRESHPICFVIQALLNLTKYHSEIRCVVVHVEGENSSNATQIKEPGTTLTPNSLETTTTIQESTSSLQDLTSNLIGNDPALQEINPAPSLDIAILLQAEITSDNLTSPVHMASEPNVTTFPEGTPNPFLDNSTSLETIPAPVPILFLDGVNRSLVETNTTFPQIIPSTQGDISPFSEAVPSSTFLTSVQSATEGSSTSPETTPTVTGDTSSSSEMTPTVTGDTTSSSEMTPTVTGDTSSSSETTPTVTGDTSSSPEMTPTVTGDTSSSPEMTPTVTGDTSVYPEMTPTVTGDTSSSPEMTQTRMDDTSASPEMTQTVTEDTSSFPEMTPTIMDDTSASPEMTQTVTEDTSASSKELPTSTIKMSTLRRSTPPQTETTPAKQGVVLRLTMRISSSVSLSDEDLRDSVIPLVEAKLFELGLPSDSSLTFVRSL